MGLMMKFTEERPFAKPEAPARKLLEIVLSKDIDVGQYTYTGVTNTAFLQAGGNVAEYLAGGGITGSPRAGSRSDTSGTRIVLLQAGA
jgi:hypothetical protein